MNPASKKWEPTRGLLARIHILAKDAGVDYKAFLFDRFGVESCLDLSQRQFALACNLLAGQANKNKPKRGKAHKQRRYEVRTHGGCSEGQCLKLIGDWVHLPVKPKLKTMTALKKFVRKFGMTIMSTEHQGRDVYDVYHVTGTADQLRRIIDAVKAIKARELKKARGEQSEKGS